MVGKLVLAGYISAPYLGIVSTYICSSVWITEIPAICGQRSARSRCALGALVVRARCALGARLVRSWCAVARAW